MKEKKTLLVVDDTKANIDILMELLGEKYEVLVALDGRSAIEIADEMDIDLMLLDIMMPEMDGFEVCSVLKSMDATKDIPIIFITAKTDEDSIEEAYEVGGIDFVTKPFRPRELLARIKIQIQLQNLIQELETSKQELKHLASTDFMTKLYNRRYFSNVSNQILKIARRDGSNLSVIMIDIDNFKNVNDVYGHKIGDDVIIGTAKTLMKSLRESDIACRFGGEEFMILLPDTDLRGCIIIAQKIREMIEKEIFKTQDNNDFNITISAGVSQVKNKKDIDIETAITRADTALYEAKSSGKNMVCYAK